MILRFRWFIVAAIVLIVLAIIAAASATTTLWGTVWYIWLCASLLSFYVDLLVHPYIVGRNTAVQGQTVVQQAPPA